MVRWTVVLAVYNEAEFLPATLASLLSQREPAQIIIVDNGSTDGCIDAARLQAAGHDHVEFLTEDCPGQVHALRRGLDAAHTEFVAVCDADTFYPPDYLTRAEAILSRSPDSVAACAWPAQQSDGRWARMMARLHRLGAFTLMPRQNHVGGSSHAFRTAALRAAGGYHPDLWPYVLKDHEMMHRVLQHGRQGFAWHHWCAPSDRRQDRRAVRWTLGERLRYHFTPFKHKTAFFRDWLAPRFAARGKADTVLRDQPWLNDEMAI